MKFPEIHTQYIKKIDLAFKDYLKKYLSPALAEMVSYHYNTGGKRLRPLCVFFAAKKFGKKSTDDFLLPFAVAVEMIHNATLIHDDIQDGDVVRRGQATLWKKYSLAQGINCGDALFFVAEKILQETPYEDALKLKIEKLLQEKTLQVIEGQATEFILKENIAKKKIPTEIEYQKMVEGKTAALFSLPLVGGAILSGLNNADIAALEELSTQLGFAFQIHDDYIDLWGEKGRGQVGSDIAEGKLSYPFILAWKVWGEATRKKALKILLTERAKTKKTDIKWMIYEFERLEIQRKIQQKISEILDGVNQSNFDFSSLFFIFKD